MLKLAPAPRLVSVRNSVDFPLLRGWEVAQLLCSWITTFCSLQRLPWHARSLVYIGCAYSGEVPRAQGGSSIPLDQHPVRPLEFPKGSVCVDGLVPRVSVFIVLHSGICHKFDEADLVLVNLRELCR